MICCWSCGFSPENLRDDVAESEESVVRTGVGVDRSILNELFRRKNVEVDLFIPGVPKTPNLSEDMPRTWFPRVPVGEERSTDFAEDASESPPSPPPLPHGDEAPSSAKDGLRRKVMRRWFDRTSRAEEKDEEAAADPLIPPAALVPPPPPPAVMEMGGGPPAVAGEEKESDGEAERESGESGAGELDGDMSRSLTRSL